MIRVLFCLLFAISSAPTLAEQKAIPMPGDTKLVTFTFDANNTYTILARPRNITDIALHQDEEVVAMALGDTVQWMVVEAPGHVFIKPLHPDIVTSGTLVTNKRTYQLSLRSSPEDGVFYQRVSWNYPDLIVLRNQQAARVKASIDMERARIDSTIVSPNVSLEKLNFDYEISGSENWKPAQVFDDGQFTWIKLGKTQEIPAVFAIGKDGKGELVNMNVRGEFMVVQRILPVLLLKLGDKEVTVRNRKMESEGGFRLPFWSN